MNIPFRAGLFRGVALLLGTLPSLLNSLYAQQTGAPQEPPRDLADMSIEDLMKIQVTSVARKEQALIDAPSAVTVLRGEDLRRTGVRSLAEAFRLVPGMQVARIDANKWAVSARGFNDRFANKLLVLIDGRVVYSPLFSGVFWEQQETMIEDIERIEVIRGPGAAIWGSNAVNGVINIATKKAKDTQGGLLVAGGGTEERAFGAARYGGKEGEDLAYRVFVKYFNRDEAYKGRDDWFQSRAGLRADWTPSDRDTLTVQGEYYTGESRGLLTEAILAPPFTNTFSDLSRQAGGHLIAGWERRFDGKSRLSTQFTYDHTRFTDDEFSETRDTAEINFQYRFQPIEGHDVVWGAGYRLTSDRIGNGTTLAYDPDHRTHGLASVFVQDEIALVEDRLHLTLGSRFEYNEYTRFEVQPSARLSWRPHERHALWAAASRAVRMPSRTEDEVRINFAVLPTAPLPTEVALFGDHGFVSEELVALEMGYRVQPADALSLDLALFYNIYDRLRTFEPATPFLEPLPAPAHFVQPLHADNKADGRTCGLEVSAAWRVTEGWTLTGAYTLFRMRLNIEDDSLDTLSEDAERQSPRNQASLRSSWDLFEKLQLDAALRYVDVVPGWDVDSFVELDARLAWKVTPDLEISLVGQNLLHGEHLEAAPSFIRHQSTEVQRGAYLSVSWRF